MQEIQRKANLNMTWYENRGFYWSFYFYSYFKC